MIDDQPHIVDGHSGYTTPIHGEARELPHLLLEIHNDLISDAEGQGRWATPSQGLAPLSPKPEKDVSRGC